MRTPDAGTVCWQKILKDKGGRSGQLGLWKPRLDLSPEIRRVNYDTAKQIILDYEWLGSMGNTEISYGIFWGLHLGGVVCFGKTTGPHLARGVCGPEYEKKTCQLSRGACVWWSPPNTASRLIGGALRLLEKDTDYRIVVAFADPRAREIGTIYQATNWLYTGLSKRRTEIGVEGRALREDFHSLGLPAHLKCKDGITALGLRPKVEIRPQKHRYIKLLGTYKERKQLRAALRYPILPYPKRAVEVSGERRDVANI